MQGLLHPTHFPNFPNSPSGHSLTHLFSERKRDLEQLVQKLPEPLQDWQFSEQGLQTLWVGSSQKLSEQVWTQLKDWRSRGAEHFVQLSDRKLHSVQGCAQFVHFLSFMSLKAFVGQSNEQLLLKRYKGSEQAVHEFSFSSQLKHGLLQGRHFLVCSSANWLDSHVRTHAFPFRK